MRAGKRKQRKTKTASAFAQLSSRVFDVVFKNKFVQGLSLNMIVAITMGVAMAGLVSWMAFSVTEIRGVQNVSSAESDFMPIQKVEVEGKFKNANMNKLEAMVSRYTDAGFFSVDVNMIETVASKLDWIKSVSVRRVWPDTLEIIIDEHDVFAVWNGNGLINSQGELFNPTDIPENYLLKAGNKVLFPKLSGPDGSHDVVVEKYKQIESELRALDLHIAELEMDGRYSWRLLLDNNVSLQFGRDQADVAIERFVEIFSGSFARNLKDIRNVDLRYTNGMAISWVSKKVHSEIKNSDSLRGNI